MTEPSWQEALKNGTFEHTSEVYPEATLNFCLLFYVLYCRPPDSALDTPKARRSYTRLSL